MNTELAFVGDVHGNVAALTGIWRELTISRVPHTVFLGDFVNKGSHSAEVLTAVLAWQATGKATLLAGNHEIALLDALDRSDLSGFLKMGGAATIRSYVGGQVGPDVLADFKAKIPSAHVTALRDMPTTFETHELLAQHVPPPSSAPKYHISAHTPVGDLPRFGARSAHLDTGCGAGSGRLTALLWPSLTYIQVDAIGSLVAAGPPPPR